MDEKSTRAGMVKNQESNKTRNRRYKIHSYLRKMGYTVLSRKRTIIVPIIVTVKCDRMAQELLNYGYALQTQLFKAK